MAEDINTRLAHALITHTVYVQRLENGALKRLLTALIKTEKDILAIIKDRYPDIPGGTDELNALTTFQLRQLQNVAVQIDTILSDSRIKADALLRSELTDFAVNEGDLIIGIFNRQIPPSTGIQLKFEPFSLSAVERMVNTPLGGEMFADRLIRNYGESLSRVQAALTDALIRGETVRQATLRVAGILDDTLVNRAEALVRTEFARVQNYTTMAAMRQNQDVLNGWIWLSSLNVNVCPICMRLHGQKFRFDSGMKPPPAHPRCVCVPSPWLKSAEDLGFTSADIPDDLKGLFTGEAPKLPLDYDEYLRSRPAAFQKQALGPARYKLFQKGVSVKDMATDTKVLTIDELKAA